MVAETTRVDGNGDLEAVCIEGPGQETGKESQRSRRPHKVSVERPGRREFQKEGVMHSRWSQEAQGLTLSVPWTL